MVFKLLCVLVLWTKVASALEGLMKAPADFKSVWSKVKLSLLSQCFWIGNYSIVRIFSRICAHFSWLIGRLSSSQYNQVNDQLKHLANS